MWDTNLTAHLQFKECKTIKGTNGLGSGGNGEMLVKGYKFCIIRWVKVWGFNVCHGDYSW